MNKSKDALSPDTFPLPSLKAKLEAVAKEVHNGRGIAIIRNLDPSKYSFEDGIVIYAGIASYIGEKRGTQDKDGNILGKLSTTRPDLHVDLLNESFDSSH